MPARDGQTAASAATTMIAGRLMLYPREPIPVRRAGDEPPPDVPEASKDNHYS